MNKLNEVLKQDMFDDEKRISKEILTAIIEDLTFGYDLNGTTHDAGSLEVSKIVKKLEVALEGLKE